MPEQIMGYVKKILIYALLVIPGIIIYMLGKTSYGDKLPEIGKYLFQKHFSILMSIYLLALLFIFIMYKYLGVFLFAYMQRQRTKLKEKAEIRDMRLGVNRQ